jgi:predicted nucleotidyltransferase
MDFRRPLQVVTPTLDADVLAILARADVEMSGREIRRRARRGSHQGIRNAADRLAREGIVERRSVGSAHLYSLNRSHVAAEWVEKLATLPEQLLERLRHAIAAWAQPPLLAMLFGSVASGQASGMSDVDLLIVRPRNCDPDDPAWNRQLSELQTNVTAWSGNDARVLEYGEGELAHAAGEPVLQDALRDGIELYGSRRVLRQSAGSRGVS